MFYTKRSHIHFGTFRANAFFLNNLFKDSRGTVPAFEINQLKRLNGLHFKYDAVRAFDFFSVETENFREKVQYASRKVTASVIKILTENGRVRYGVVDKFEAPAVIYFYSNF